MSCRRINMLPHSLCSYAVGVMLALAGCTPNAEPEVAEPPPAELPELATVGGAQDLWAFPFSLSATRDEVEELYGVPTARRTDADRGGSGARIVEWDYNGVTLSFFVRTDGSDEYLVSARITGGTVPINGSVRIGMPVDQVGETLGEPQLDSGTQLVYFFSFTTIEIAYREDLVEAVTLGRALP